MRTGFNLFKKMQGKRGFDNKPSAKRTGAFLPFLISKLNQGLDEELDFDKRISFLETFVVAIHAKLSLNVYNEEG